MDAPHADVDVAGIPGLQFSRACCSLDLANCARSWRAGAPGQPLCLPAQGALGDCWLLTAAVALQRLLPRIIYDMFDLRDDEVRVLFPRAEPVRMNYRVPAYYCSGRWAHVGARVLRNSDAGWALLEKAVCILLARDYPERVGAKRSRDCPHLRARRPQAHYADIHGGLIEFGLRMLAPEALPSPVHVCSAAARDLFRALAGGGVFFIEVDRAGVKHALLAVRACSTHFLAYDPWGAWVRQPYHHGRVFFVACESLLQDSRQLVLVDRAPGHDAGGRRDGEDAAQHAGQPGAARLDHVGRFLGGPANVGDRDRGCVHGKPGGSGADESKYEQHE